MSLRIMPIPAVPDETARITQAAFPHGTLLVQIRDALGTLYTDESLTLQYLETSFCTPRQNMSAFVHLSKDRHPRESRTECDMNRVYAGHETCYDTSNGLLRGTWQHVK